LEMEGRISFFKIRLFLAGKSAKALRWCVFL